MTWIVTTNSNLCRIYQYDVNPEKITLIKELNHPENKLKKSEYLTSDKPGHYQSGVANGGAFEPRTDPKDVEIDNFIREIARELNQGRNAHGYTNLVIIAPSHLNGILSKHLDKHVKELIKKEIQNDVMQLAHHEFLEFIKKNLKFQ